MRLAWVKLAVFLAAKDREGDGWRSCRDREAEKRWAFMMAKQYSSDARE